MTTIKQLAAVPARVLRSQLRQQSIRSLSSTKGPNLPANDSSKSLSNRDNRIFAQVKKMRSAILHDPPVLTKGFHPTAITNNGVYMGSTFLEYAPQPLPQLHAHALLNPKSYCQKSASASHTISGGDAARRLIRGKQDLMETMRNEIHDGKADDDVVAKQLYVLWGHGVPPQLLHHHLHTARSWLASQEEDVTELSVQHVSGASQFDQMLIRTDDGATHTSTWPKEWDHAMELYVTVMTRMADQLSPILNPKEGREQPRLKHWNVAVKAAGPEHSSYAFLPPDLIPPFLVEGKATGDASTAVVVVVEILPTEGSAAGRVSIRLQKHATSTAADRTKKNDDDAAVSVVMAFEGTYHTK